MDLKELHGWEGDLANHWYYAAKARAVRRILGEGMLQRIADIGAGSGFFARELLSATTAREAWCVDVNYPAETEEEIGGKRILYRRRTLPLCADLYLLMDVLEHVEDDRAFLAQVADAAPPGARFLVTVPAFRFLWSGHDDYLGHHRRYTLNEITAVVTASGLRVEHAAYYFAAIFPAVAAVRLCARLMPGRRAARSDMRRVSGPVNRLLRRLCRWEEHVFPRNRCFGLTAFVLARRPDAPEATRTCSAARENEENAQR